MGSQKHNRKKYFIVAVLLAAYINVFVTQISCNLHHIFESEEVEHSHEGNHHHDADEGTPAAGHHGDEDSKDNNCCNDKTSSFFASQTHPANPAFEFKNTFLTHFVNYTSDVFESNPSFIPSKGYYSYESPPPKIPDIPVFTHSFLI